MKKQVKKLNSLLKKVEKNENKRAVMLVYLSVVFLGKKFSEVAVYFNIPELKVQAGVTKLAFRLRTDKFFYKQMHYVVKWFVKEDKLQAVA